MSDSGRESDSVCPRTTSAHEPGESFAPPSEGEGSAGACRARIEAEITRAELHRAAQLLSQAGNGPTRSIRAAFAGEARDTYDAAMRRLERLRGTQAEESLKLASLRVRLLLEEAERGQTLLPLTSS
jgi:hypothetical protein